MPLQRQKKLVIGHPACLSGKYAKAGEQAIGGIKACIDWVNNVYAGVLVGKKRIPLDYKYYDCESKKEGVTSLIERLITVDKVSVVFPHIVQGSLFLELLWLKDITWSIWITEERATEFSSRASSILCKR